MAWGCMNQSRYEKLNSKGNLQDVCELIERETSVEIKTIYNSINNHVEKLRSERQRELFKMYYFNNLSIISIHYYTGLEYCRIENHLNSAINNLIKSYSKYEF